MKSWFGKTALATVALLASGAASADQNIWMGLKAGTLGLGVEAAWRPLPWFDVRAGANQFTYDDTGSQAGVNYDAELSLDSFYATANFRFPLSPMRFTAGLYSNGNELELTSRDAAAIDIAAGQLKLIPVAVKTSRDAAAIDIGGTVYPAASVGTLNSVTSFQSTAPYAGVGFDFDVFGKVGLNLDFGVLWQGDPDVTLTADGILATDPTFQDALEAERQELINEVEDYKAWPVVSVGFTYKFM